MNIIHFLKHLNKLLNLYMHQTGVSGKKKAYIKDKLAMFHNTAEEWGIPFIWLLNDYFITFLIHGEPSEYYIREEMYKYNFMEKRRRLTVSRAFILDYKYNINATEEEKQRIYNKKLFNIFYKDFIHREWRYAPDETTENLRSFINKQKKVFCKPHNLSMGTGIFVLQSDDATAETIQKLINQKYIIEEIIDQHPAVKNIHPESVNTLRIFSIIDSLGIPHVGLCELRVGIGSSVTDNISAGGIFYIVDSKTGIIISPGKTNRERKRYIRHPGSDVIMPGFRIPYYQQICDMIKKAALITPTLRYVGWDVAITPNGPILIEGNIEVATTNQGADGLYYEARKYL